MSQECLQCLGLSVYSRSPSFVTVILTLGVRLSQTFAGSSCLLYIVSLEFLLNI